LTSDDGKVRFMVNGELYGYRAIRNALQTDGRHFTTDSDSETALHLYEQLGGDFVHQLRGEFAVVVADRDPVNQALYIWTRTLLPTSS
jgi:asparagine synthase (glutamine-hydrolysing)